MNLKEILRDFNEAVNETALTKSDFYKQSISEIKGTISRKRTRIDHEGNPIYYELEIELEDLEGNKILDKDGKTVKKTINVPYLEEVSIDDMISGMFSLGSRGNKFQRVPDSFIKRIGRSAKYARVLQNTKQFTFVTSNLQEIVRQDVEIVMKIILPDLTKVTMPAHQKLAQGAAEKPRLSDMKTPPVFET